ncbi:hypothetical protein N7519_004107 [Penicillium mononematosum]|uniref:uncharacterized protein n=1 Tax=Penicillium mononematosum TaxID=268346 RepID=UPI00254758DC|nr:uncharacterized protein N7519_004107 [Penicillium mononematosum]KAJ6189199.1 hypothetical protein N7519_004107 [Penicillium mononematosum]
MLDTKLDIGTEISGGRFLGDLGPPIRRYPYKGVTQLLHTLKTEKCRQQEDVDVSDWVIFTKVNSQAFTRDFLNSESMERRWNSYDSLENLILVKVLASHPHEAAARQFERLLFQSLLPMGLDNSLRTLGSATCIAENGSAKQPDCQYLPRRLPKARTDKWSSLVVESDLSESPSKLMSDARFWLTESSGEVQMVITIMIGRSTPEIVLESWEHDNDSAKRTQVVIIGKGENNHLYLRGQPLIIGFDKLFLRPPSTSKETDIIFDDDILKQMGTLVWVEQEF